MGPPRVPHALAQVRGPGAVLNAVDLDAEAVRWSRRLDPDDARELDRIREAGLQIRETSRSFEIAVDAESSRRYQLSRTVPHEVGHWVDWRRTVVLPAGQSADGDALARLSERYWARPTAEHEAAAHRYADQAQRWLQEG